MDFKLAPVVDPRVWRRLVDLVQKSFYLGHVIQVSLEQLRIFLGGNLFLLTVDLSFVYVILVLIEGA